LIVIVAIACSFQVIGPRKDELPGLRRDDAVESSGASAPMSFRLPLFCFFPIARDTTEARGRLMNYGMTRRRAQCAVLAQMARVYSPSNRDQASAEEPGFPRLPSRSGWQ
jgi:hypothetical protein